MTVVSVPAPGDTCELRLALPRVDVLLSGEIDALTIDAVGDLCGFERGAPSDRTLHVGVEERDDGLHVLAGNHVLAIARTDRDLPDVLVGVLNRLVLDTDPYRLHVHAACVELDGVGVLIAGPSGSGKSTVTTELLRIGARYLTDESLTVLLGSRTVFAYPKPITLKEAGAGLGPGLELPPASDTGRISLRASSITELAPFSTVGVIVFPQFQALRPNALTALTPADVVSRLLTDSLDAVRIGTGSLDAVAGLANDANAWALEYHDATVAARLIAELQAPPRRSFTVVHNLPGPLPNISGPISMARFDNSAVLFDATTKATVRLAGTEADALEQLVAGREPAAGVLDRIRGLGLALPAPAPPPTPRSRRGFGLPGTPSVTGGPEGITDVARRNHSGVAAEILVRSKADLEADPARTLLTSHHEKQATCARLEPLIPRVFDRLWAADIDPMLAGPVVLSHDGQLPCHFTDATWIDLLVDPSDVVRAASLLRAIGLQPTVPRAGATTALTGAAPSGSLDVRLSSSLTPRTFVRAPGLPVLRRRSVPVRIHGRFFPTLEPGDRFVHACLRMASDPRLSVANARDVALSAPRSEALVVSTIARARTSGLLAIIQWACTQTERLVGGIPPGLLVGPERRKAATSQRALLAVHRRCGDSTVPRLLGRAFGRIGTGNPTRKGSR